MRIRRLSALFWFCCALVFVFILYVMTDLSFKLPSIKPPVQSLDESKWSAFESKLRHIENELNQHHAVVGEIKSAVNQIVQIPPQKSQYVQGPKPESMRPAHKMEDTKTYIVSKQGTLPTFNISQCALRKETLPKTDIQMLSLYERLDFKDVDGGVWKQGWEIEYSEKQWSSAHPLKVFIVPHSHNDPGWLKTFENYYKTQTRVIFDNMVTKLNEVPGRKFIWAETSFLALWWASDATAAEKESFKKLLNSGNIEIVTGGWVMNDEANSHYLSVIQQLTTGQQWLLQNLQYIPRNHWSIDPFGYSSSQPYLLKLAGFQNSVIQRVHYRIKKELAMNRQLEFKWRQLWDGLGKTDMFTHVMPFYSYDVPHTCGPDPKVCCQFDFRRLPGHGVTCPWGIPPKKIIHKNVAERAYLILDQWRKKAQLYRSNVVLVPLGDDFRYDRAAEWDNQFGNYEMLIDYINNNDQWNAQVQFGTLNDYFQALHEEVKLSEFPVLSGDFFTYADRNQHYWSGYYTSRPFYKAMDRVLLAYVRAAETITAQLVVEKLVSQVVELQLRDRVEAARRSLALFQHHDGVTGTARNDVREDYAKKMLQGIKYCQSAIQQAAWHLLKQPQIAEQTQEDIYFAVDDIWRRHDEVPSRATITLDILSPSRRIVLYNALNFNRTEIVTVIVSTPHVEVFDMSGEPIMAQVSPVVTGQQQMMLLKDKFQLSFPVTVPALGLVTYTLSARSDLTINKHTSYAHVRVYNADYLPVELPKMFPVEQPAGHLHDDITLQAGNSTRVVADKNGLLKAVSMQDGSTFPLAMDYVQYDSLHERDNNSGAYLFIPSGPPLPFHPQPFPEIVAIEGIYKASLYTGLRAPKAAEMMLSISVYNNPSLPQTEVEVSNVFQIDPAVDDLELAMRLATRLRNERDFYTDLNGMQMIKRRYMDKLPLQANWYPLPAAAYIQDSSARLTVLTSTPLGVAATTPGQIEVMQDRRLSRDDNRGLEQGVMDNVRTRHVFRIIVESAHKQCQRPTHPEHPSGQLTLGAHISQQTLVQPLVNMQYAGGHVGAEGRQFARPAPAAADLVLASFRSHVTSAQIGSSNSEQMSGLGLVFHRVHLEQCYGSREVARHYPDSGGLIKLENYIGKSGSVHQSSLTFTQSGRPLGSTLQSICPQQARAFFVNTTRVAT